MLGGSNLVIVRLLVVLVAPGDYTNWGRDNGRMQCAAYQLLLGREPSTEIQNNPNIYTNCFVRFSSMTSIQIRCHITLIDVYVVPIIYEDYESMCSSSGFLFPLC